MKHPRLLWAAGVGAWLVAVGAGLGMLMDYDTTPGDPGRPPKRWPESSGLRRSPGRTAIVMIAHPQCPCTRASLAELERIMARGGDRLEAFALFVSPASAGASWAESDLWHRAAAIPGVHPIKDLDGAEARRFGGETSGQALLFDGDGDLRFAGGITAARGHEGLSTGGRAILAILDGREPIVEEAPVFGCPMHEPGDEPPDEEAEWPM